MGNEAKNGQAVDEQLREQLDAALAKIGQLEREKAELENEVEAMSEELHLSGYYEKKAWRLAHALQEQMIALGQGGNPGEDT